MNDQCKTCSKEQDCTSRIKEAEIPICSAYSPLESLRKGCKVISINIPDEITKKKLIQNILKNSKSF